MIILPPILTSKPSKIHAYRRNTLRFIVLCVAVLGFVLTVYSFNVYNAFDIANITFPLDRFELAKADSSKINTYLSANERDDLYFYQYEKFGIYEVPKDCINAIVSIEDKTFWQNNGVDGNGVIRLVFSIIPGNSASGGSTISQQVIKIATDRFYNRTIFDKITEIMWAIKLNQVKSKSEILDIYLNNAYFGGYNFGAQAASKEYFNKDISELNLDECAYLMGIPQSPNNYAPVNEENKNRGQERKEQVLEAMKKEGYI
jgi:penicillin-binding protein 2A